MSVSVNSVIIGGNVTRDPELNQSVGVVRFGVAVNEKYKAKDGTLKESVAFVDCEAWGKTAEMVAQYVHKGDPVLVEGQLKSDQWQTQSGEKRQKLLLRAQRVHFIGARREVEAADIAAQKPRTVIPSAVDADAPPF